MWVARHAVASAAVAVALAIVAGVFVFARPQYRPDLRTTNYDMTSRTHYTVQQARAAFASQGFRFPRRTVMTSDAPGAYMWSLSSNSGVDVSVFGPRAKVGWGRQPHDPLNEIVGNVGVTYYGSDRGVINRAKAAIRALAD